MDPGLRHAPQGRERAGHVCFGRAGVTQDQAVLPHAASQIIFCRNAFIYFSPHSVKQVVSTLEEAMPVPGFLFLGASESLVSASNRCELEDVESAFVYTKR